MCVQALRAHLEIGDFKFYESFKVLPGFQFILHQTVSDVQSERSDSFRLKIALEAASGLKVEWKSDE